MSAVFEFISPSSTGSSIPVGTDCQFSFPFGIEECNCQNSLIYTKNSISLCIFCLISDSVKRAIFYLRQINVINFLHHMTVNSTQSNEMEHSIITQREQSDFEDIFNHQIDQINSPELTEGQIQAISLLCGSEVLIAALELLDLKLGKVISSTSFVRDTRFLLVLLGPNIITCFIEDLVRRLSAIKNGPMIYEVNSMF
jgi:hypothetical protein